MKTLDAMERAALRNLLPAWFIREEALERAFRFADFREALAFVVRIGDVAEELGHHPDIDIRYSVVHLSLTTHDAGGLTAADVELAKRIDVCARVEG